MLVPEAYRIVGDLLAPVPAEAFFDGVVGRRFLKIPGAAEGVRTRLLGLRPEERILGAFARLAPTLTSHAEGASGPPPVSEAVADAAAFRAKVSAFHDRGYTVRIPDLRGLSLELDLAVRALEVVLQQPAGVHAFWSRAGARAPVHHDDEDLIVVQLAGRKQWFVSGETSQLPNRWRGIPSGPPRIDRPVDFEMAPGDLLYLPRGTYHRVESTTDSLHLSIGFTPLTVRDAIIAALDHLSDLDRPLREGADAHPALSVRRNAFAGLPGAVRAGAERLAEACRSDDFVAEAMQRRASRMVAELPKLGAAPAEAELSGSSRLRRSPLAACHVTANAAKLDVSYPGGHLYIHRGAQEGVLFMVETREFRLGDIPGGMDEEVLVALARRFLEVGILEVVPA